MLVNFLQIGSSYGASKQLQSSAHPHICTSNYHFLNITNTANTI